MSDNVSHESLSLYDATADKAASAVIKQYSSSFHIATCLYPKPIRRDIRNLYAVVRIADEIVDGTLHKANSLAGNTYCMSNALASMNRPSLMHRTSVFIPTRLCTLTPILPDGVDSQKNTCKHSFAQCAWI